jgi:carbamate kinase
LLADRHVIAGGGGGIAVDETGAPLAAVIDKDWTAALLAVGLGASALINITDVPHVARGYGGRAEARIARLTVDEAEDLLAAKEFAPGSMAPKVESAVDFARATGHWAVITTIGQVQAALAGRAGTLVLPD